MTLRKGYSSTDLKADLANLYQKTGLKNLGTVFLMTDAQVNYTVPIEAIFNITQIKLFPGCRREIPGSDQQPSGLGRDTGSLQRRRGGI